jgi:hypothetical protein
MPALSSKVRIEMNSKGTILILVGLIILVFTVGSVSVFESWIGSWSLWIMAIGFPSGGFLILKGREKLGLKNKYFS